MWFFWINGEDWNQETDKYQYPIFNGFVPKGFGQGVPSPGMGILWWAMTLQIGSCAWCLPQRLPFTTNAGYSNYCLKYEAGVMLLTSPWKSSQFVTMFTQQLSCLKWSFLWDMLLFLVKQLLEHLILLSENHLETVLPKWQSYFV